MKSGLKHSRALRVSCLYIKNSYAEGNIVVSLALKKFDQNSSENISDVSEVIEWFRVSNVIKLMRFWGQIRFGWLAVFERILNLKSNLESMVTSYVQCNIRQKYFYGSA